MIKIDQNKCVGCGLCAGQHPESFQMNLDGKAEVINSQETPGAQKAISDCPAGAISSVK